MIPYIDIYDMTFWGRGEGVWEKRQFGARRGKIDLCGTPYDDPV